MGITAESGPIVSYGITQNSTISGTAVAGVTGVPMEYNEERAPSLFDLGVSLEDPRTFYSYQPGNAVGITSTSTGGAIQPKVVGFYNGRAYADLVPLTASTNALVSATVVTTGVTGAFTLNAASTARGTFAVSIIAPETGNSTSVTTFDSSAPMFLSYGSAGTVGLWNPAQMAGRIISITTSSSGDLGTWTVIGRDVYGYKITEQIALSQGTTNSSGYTIVGQKAFKYISQIINASTPVSTGVSIGVADTFGFPFTVPYTGADVVLKVQATGNSTGTVFPSTANVILASTRATQTSTTPDVRGTWASSVASNATVRIQIGVTLAASAAAAITPLDVSAAFGAAQFSSV